jgi:hypothetical protein
MRSAGVLLGIGVLLCVLCGCSHSSRPLAKTTSSIQGGRIAITILWPARGRVIPEETQSIAITVAGPNNYTQRQVATRPTNGGTTTLSFASLPVGHYLCTAVAYLQPDGTGTVLARGSVQTSVAVNTIVPVVITMATTVTHMTVTAGNVLPYLGIGESFALYAAPLDVAGHLVLVDWPALEWTSSDQGVATVDSYGNVTGTGLGEADITVKHLETGVTATFHLKVVSAGISVTITPGEASIRTSETAPFAAEVANAQDTAVMWSVWGGLDAGSVNGSGVYTPSGVPGVYTIVATSVEDPRKFGTATVTVTSPVAILPETATVSVTKTLQYGASVSEVPNTPITWSVIESNGGAITQDGLYTAPALPGIFHIKAENTNDPTQFVLGVVQVVAGSANVTVANFPVEVVSWPNPANVAIGQGFQIYTEVRNTPNPGITYAVMEPDGGTVTPAGYYKAPLLPGTYHVMVTSNADPTKYALVTIYALVGGMNATVTDVPISFFLGNTDINLAIGQRFQFHAYINNWQETDVTWGVVEANGGTISTSGLYTAPLTAGVYHIKATSKADPTRVLTTSVTALDGSLNVTIEDRPLVLSPNTWEVGVAVTQHYQFYVTVANSANAEVTWRVEEAGGGTITPTGLYTAPRTAGVYHVTATSKADPTKSITMTVQALEGAADVTVH